jgi:hypothetical protein
MDLMNVVYQDLAVTFEDSCGNVPVSPKALYAVVQLHSPIACQILDYEYMGCMTCYEWSHEGDANVHYPCKTIQTIQKALTNGTK